MARPLHRFIPATLVLAASFAPAQPADKPRAVALTARMREKTGCHILTKP